MGLEALEELGLSKGEIKIYSALLELGPSKVGGIIKKSKMAGSAAHSSINSLIDKGLLSYIREGKSKSYMAVSPKQLLEFAELKKQKIKEILPELELRQKKLVDKEEAEIFEGKRGIISALKILIEDTKPKDEFLFFSADIEEKNKEIQEFYSIYDTKRKDKKLEVKGISPNTLRNLFEGRKYVKMKYVDFPIPENTGMCNNKMVIISWSEPQKAILIVSKEIVSKQRKFFNAMWKIAKA